MKRLNKRIEPWSPGKKTDQGIRAQTVVIDGLEPASERSKPETVAEWSKRRRITVHPKDFWGASKWAFASEDWVRDTRMYLNAGTGGEQIKYKYTGPGADGLRPGAFRIINTRTPGDVTHAHTSPPLVDREFMVSALKSRRYWTLVEMREFGSAGAADKLCAIEQRLANL